MLQPITIWRKIIKRYSQFKVHPISKRQPLKALLRYLYYNVRLQFEKEILVSWIDGLKFYARKGDAGIIANAYYGLYEFNESLFLLHYLKPVDLFLDAGANVGHYALLASGICKAETLAIEPVPETFNQLQKNIKLNALGNLINSKNIGLSHKDGKLYFSTDAWAMNRVVESSYKNNVQVKVSSIDQIVSYKIPSIIKIDAEGFEASILAGAKKTLTNITLNVVILEINGQEQRYASSAQNIVEQLSLEGFKAYSYNANKRELKPLKNYNKTQFNSIFIRDLELANIRLKASKPIKIWDKYI